MKIIIIGGSDAGISAALRAREVNPNTQPTIILADQYPNFSICGLPFYLSGEVTDWRSLAHRDIAAIESHGVVVRRGYRCTGIDPVKKTICVNPPSQAGVIMGYDKLVLCTGARSTSPGMSGLDLPGVFLLRWMDDCFVVEKYINDNQPKSIIIIGAGYIGMEMADAMTRRGLAVTVIEYVPSVLSTLDDAMGKLVLKELETNGVKVITGASAKKIELRKHQIVVQGEFAGNEGFEIEGDMVLVATGTRPETEPGLSAGIQIGVAGAIKINSLMETSLPNIYAAGDCAETRHRLLSKNTWLPLGTTAHKQGRVAGENAAGGNRVFAGSLGTQSVKIFRLVAARTGLKDNEAGNEGFAPLSVDTEAPDHKAYYPGSGNLHIRVTGDLATGNLLGAQIIGPYGAEVSKRIDIFAAALHHGMKVRDLCDLDLSYTPPLSSPWDPVQMAAMAWEQVWERHQQP